MSEVERIAALLRDKDLPVVGEIVPNPSTPGGYFVPLRLTRTAGGGKSPSGRTLALTRSSLAELGYVIDFILLDEETPLVEESLRASLLSSFPADVRNSFLADDKGSPHAWIEFKRKPDTEIVRRLEEHLRKFAELFSLPSLRMTPIGEANTATRIEILSAIRQLAPVDPPSLAKELAAQGHDVPSPDWTNRRLDALRKSNLVLRRPDGTYVLTREALAKLGTRKGPRSPDVSRFLALARRGM
ncbi:MAG TPA: hypothetical protein VND19_02925 [Acetobacteraceae bacterium]|nr:hypothetical protein [Acetobacteraceae bacterium]